MRTAISESGRAVLEERIQTWIKLEEGQLEQVHRISLQLGISEDDVVDMLNECANSRAALDRFGIEVYPEALPVAEQVVSPKLEAGADDAFRLEVLAMWFARFLLGAVVVVAVLGVMGWLLA